MGQLKKILLTAAAIFFACSSLIAQKEIVVALDGSGNFKSIQEAINSLSMDAKAQRVILIKKGLYHEKIFIDRDFITLRGEDVANTTISISQSRDIFRCDHPDDWGVATINLKGNDINLENLTFINSYGLDTKNDLTIPCKNDTSGSKLIRPGGHQMALRSFLTTRLIVKNCVFRAYGGDTVSPWNTDDGMFYFKDCIMEGGVDFYCPRGWALAENCTFICHSMEAAIWHDGSKVEKSKTVLVNCKFTGDDGFKLGRYHRDAQFYLFNCSFPKNMADADIYQREANPPNVIQWGRRVYYYNCTKEGVAYAWYKNNLPAGFGINDFNVPWVYDYKWNPEKSAAGTGNAAVGGKSMVDTVAENMLLYQRSNGGWPKHFKTVAVDYKKILTADELKELQAGYAESIDATIDNNATTKEIWYLTKAFKKTNDKRFLDAAEKGIDYLLKAQYANGGWPQFYPDFSSYRSEITYNDNAMTNVLNVLADVSEAVNDMEVINRSYRNKCADAVKRGIDCILKTQIKQNGQLTVWCAQYDAKTLLPAKARAYELPSLSGQESVGIIRFLMRISDPNEEERSSIKAGVDWLNKVKITGYKFVDVKAPAEASGRDRVLVPDNEGVLWARFYDLDSNEPFFCGRDGQKKKTIAEVENERRVGYAWYGNWPLKLLTVEYPSWKSKQGIKN